MSTDNSMPVYFLRHGETVEILHPEVDALCEDLKLWRRFAVQDLAKYTRCLTRAGHKCFYVQRSSL